MATGHYNYGNNAWDEYEDPRASYPYQGQQSQGYGGYVYNYHGYTDNMQGGYSSDRYSNDPTAHKDYSYGESYYDPREYQEYPSNSGDGCSDYNNRQGGHQTYSQSSPHMTQESDPHPSSSKGATRNKKLPPNKSSPNTKLHKNKPPPRQKQRDPKPVPQQPQRRRARGAPPGVKVSMCSKYTVFFINILFWIIGAFLLGFGIWGLVSKRSSSVADLAEDAGIYFDPMYAFIIVGGVIFILAFFGAIGALRENTCMLKFFAYSLILIFLGEITIIVLAYFYQDNLFGVLEQWLEQSVVRYYDDPDKQFIMDEMQEGLECCGINSPQDWELNIYFNCSSIARSSCSVPYSCCLPEDGVVNFQCGYKVLFNTDTMGQFIYTRGCADALRSWFITNSIIIGCCIGAMIIFQCLTISFARSLIGDIKAVKSYW